MPVAFEPTSIKEVIRDVSQEQSPDAALKLLLEGIVSVTRSIQGRLYLLSLRDSCYRLEFNQGRAEAATTLPAEISLEELNAGSLKDPVSQFLQGFGTGLVAVEEPAEARVPISAFLLIPVIRNASLLGLLVLEGADNTSFGDKDVQTAETAVSIIIMLLEKRSTLSLLQSLQHPIDFLLPFDNFIDELLLLVREATGMRYVALRELQPDSRVLKCLSKFGFSHEDKSLFDISLIDNYPTFQKAIEEKTTQVEPDINAPHLVPVRERPEFRAIKSFVVTPIKVGTGIFGTLSFAAEREYNYSPLEVAGFETIANSIGVAISNNRNAERVQEIFVENARVAISFTALEVAQAARHEALNRVDNSQLLLARLIKSSSSGKTDREATTRIIDQIGEELSEVARAIEKIREASRIPQMKLKSVSIRELWEQARAMVAGKISAEGVHPEIIGNAIISAYPETLRLAFLNLFLNSFDAFRDFGKRGSRRITVNVDPRADDARQIKIRYVDNASGIDINRLRVPSGTNRSSNPRDLIFELGVTSKDNGSGYGLYLVRRILDDHRGSIELVDHRGGVTFDIFLPKHQTVAAQTAKN